MAFIADLHVHSHYSRATSRDCTLEGLWTWAQLKGIRVIGTGDFTHPAWLDEIQEKLEPAPDAPGLYRLKPDVTRPLEPEVPPRCRSPVHFMLTGEISHIYRRDGRVRKVHTLLGAPNIEAVRRLNERLEQIGNIRSDGRPILGLDPRDLLGMCLDIDPNILFIPAHIWTPWFSMLGSKSGFDSLEECFGDLSEHIFAVETGLSSDPPMNWRVSFLDRVALVSNSDLHSPSRAGRNANVFLCEADYFEMRNALRDRDPERYGGTLDLFPEEGKYHLDGHRKCGVSMEPEEALALDCLCPVCGKPLVLGVLHRVVALADRPKGARPPDALPCEHFIPLPELLAELFECGPATKKVQSAFRRLLHDLGPEFVILRELPIETIESHGPALLGEAVRRVRREQVIRKGGYDGLFGEIRVFEPGEKEKLRREAVLLSLPEPLPPDTPSKPEPVAASTAVADASRAYVLPELLPTSAPSTSPQQPSLFPASPEDLVLEGLTDEQKRAVTCDDSPVLIAAGPGSGKTATLTRRVLWLLQVRRTPPESLLAVTFTNRAAGEMRARLRTVLPEEVVRRVRVCTFHAFCLDLLRRFPEKADLPPDFSLMEQEDAATLYAQTTGGSVRDARAVVERLGARLARLEPVPENSDEAACLQLAHDTGAIFLDEIIPAAVRLFDEHPEIAASLGLKYVCVDEFQDINRAQFELIRRLCPDGRGLFAIGDPDQAIYGFRGADPAFVLDFRTAFRGAKCIALSRNFRSDAAVVHAATAVIAPVRSEIAACQTPVFAQALPVRLYEAPTPAAEAEFIVHEIERWVGGVAHFSVDTGRIDAANDAGAVTFGDIAVLVRLHALVQPLAEALRRLGLPVALPAERSRSVAEARRALQRRLRRWSADLLERRADDAATEIAGHPANFGLPSKEAKALETLLRTAPPAGNETLGGWLDRVMLEGESDRVPSGVEQVTVCSIHAAKGLEFPIVFLAACERGVLPYVPPGKEAPDRLDEERRLLYVGMTRAERVLYITAARRRTLFGKSLRTGFSPFLDVLPADASYLERIVRDAPKRPRPTARQLTFDF